MLKTKQQKADTAAKRTAEQLSRKKARLISGAQLDKQKAEHKKLTGQVAELKQNEQILGSKVKAKKNLLMQGVSQYAGANASHQQRVDQLAKLSIDVSMTDKEISALIKQAREQAKQLSAQFDSQTAQHHEGEAELRAEIKELEVQHVDAKTALKLAQEKWHATR